MEGPLTGSSCTFCWGSLKEFSLYFCRKRRDALDLREKFDALKTQVNILSKKWKDLDDEIGRLSITVERNRQYDSVKERVSVIEERFKVLYDRYRKLCINSRNQSPIDVERPMPQQKTVEMMWSCKLFAFARLHTKVGTLKSDASEVWSLLKPEELVNKVTQVKFKRLYTKEIDIVGHPHKKYLDYVLKLVDEEVYKIICIYGTVSGVGVTNIMKNVHNYILNPSTPPRFDHVIWVEIKNQETREKTVEDIQKVIINSLSAPTGENRQQNSQIITSVLGEKKFLLLLDNFPKNINLEDIGIPEGKVVMTTKHYDDLMLVQDLDEKIKVDKLSREDSNYMFEKIFYEKPGQKELSELEMDEVDLILKETDGILTIIRVAAKKLANRRNLKYWQGVRQALQSDAGHDFLNTAGIRNFYKKAYDELNEDWKKCLLFVALYPSEYVIPRGYLFECWKAQSFLGNNSRFNTMRAGEFVCVNLEETGLLDRASKKNVKMPQIFRKFAKSLPYPNQGGGSATATTLVRFHPEDERVGKPWCSNASWICGAQTDLEKLSVSEKCDGLSALLLQKNARLIFVEFALFASIPNLLVLDLHGTGIKLLPTSISSLTKLQCLYLNGCPCLEKLPGELVYLTDLEVFDIRRTPIHCEPIDISHLPNLKCLRISFQKEDERWETPSRSWSLGLEELGIEFFKGVEKSVVDRVKQELKAGFGDSAIKIYLDSDFKPRKLILEKKLKQTTVSPSTSGLKQAPDPSVNITSSIHVSDKRVLQRGKEIVEEENEELQEDMQSDSMKESSTSLKQLPGNGVSQKGKEIMEEGMPNGFIKEPEDKNTVSTKEIVEERNEKVNTECSLLRQILRDYQKNKLKEKVALEVELIST